MWIHYAGSSLAGKTTSVRAIPLAQPREHFGVAFASTADAALRSLGGASDSTFHRTVRSGRFRGRPVDLDRGCLRNLFHAPMGQRGVREPSGEWTLIPLAADTPADSYDRFQADSMKRLKGVVFVVDAHRVRNVAAQEELDRLVSDLRFVGREPRDVPLVLQVNKQDVSGAQDVEQVLEWFTWPNLVGAVPSIATRGVGVTEALTRMLGALDEG